MEAENRASVAVDIGKRLSIGNSDSASQTKHLITRCIEKSNWWPGAERFAKQTTMPKAPEGRAPQVRVNRTTDTSIFSQKN
jgi:hypothetical protein